MREHNVLDDNQVYRWSNQVITKSDEMKHSELSKLTVFSPHGACEAQSQKELFLATLQAISNEFYICQRECSDLNCWELFAGNETLLHMIQNQFKASKFDYLLWPENWQSPPKLLIFDMDSTFIQIEVIDELAKRHGVGNSVSKVTEAAMKGELDFSESLISRVACLKDLADSTILDICKDLPLSEGVEQLIDKTQRIGVKVAIVSGGFTPFVEFLREKMDLYQVKANDLQVEAGKLTGALEGSIVDAQAKADYVVELATRLGLETNEILTVGDGANDLLMMRESGFSLAYRAKPAVQAEAKGRMNFANLNHLIDVFNW